MITTLRIEPVYAIHAVRAVETALAAVPGITSMDVRLGVAVIEHDGRATESLLRAAVATAGVRVTEVIIEPRHLPIHGSER